MIKKPGIGRYFSKIALLAALTTGCKESQQQAQMPPPPVVKVQTVNALDQPLINDYPGRTAGSSEVDVLARVNGLLLKRFYKEGQFVKEGDLLVQIDAEPYLAELEKAKAAFIEAESRWQRALNLYTKNALSGQERDAAVAAYKAAKSDLRNAEINLSYTAIRAPVSGLTGEDFCSDGSLLQAGSESSLVMKITQLDPLYVYFAYPDSQWLKWRQAAAEGRLKLPSQFTASVYTQDGVKHIHDGFIDFTDHAIDAATGTVKVRAVIPNPDASLLPGQFVKLALHGLVKPQAITVPETAILYGTHGPFVYSLTADSQVEVKGVKLGELCTTGRVIEAGLKPGERIITEGLIKVRPGQPVKVEESPTQAPAQHSCPCCKTELKS